MCGPWRYYRLPLSLVLIHTCLVCLIALAVQTSEDGEAGALWIIPFVLDFPASAILLRLNDDTTAFIALLIFGNAWWLVLGSLFRLAIGVNRAIDNR